MIKKTCCMYDRDVKQHTWKEMSQILLEGIILYLIVFQSYTHTSDAPVIRNSKLRAIPLPNCSTSLRVFYSTSVICIPNSRVSILSTIIWHICMIFAQWIIRVLSCKQKCLDTSPLVLIYVTNMINRKIIHHSTIL